MFEVKEVAKYLKVSEKSVRRWIAGRLLGYHRLGHGTRIVISQRQLDEFLRLSEIPALNSALLAKQMFEGNGR